MGRVLGNASFLGLKALMLPSGCPLAKSDPTFLKKSVWKSFPYHYEYLLDLMGAGRGMFKEHQSNLGSSPWISLRPGLNAAARILL